MKKGISYPEKAVLTTAKEHDRDQLEIMVDDKECIYVFDRGYLDYECFDLRAALWKPVHIWLRKIEGKAIP